MQANVGGLDRLFRIVVGVVLIGLAVSGTIGAWGWIGVVPLASGLLRFCMVYKLLGISSCGCCGGKSCKKPD